MTRREEIDDAAEIALSNAILEAAKEIDRLTDALDVAEKALEFYAGFSDEHKIFDNVSLMARETLAKIRELRGGK